MIHAALTRAYRAAAVMMVGVMFALSIPAHAEVTYSVKKVTLPVSLLNTAAATTVVNTIYRVKSAKEIIHRVVLVRDTDLAGGSVSAATVIVGKSGSTNKYLTSTDVFTGAANGWANAVLGTVAGAEVGGTEITATVTTTTANTTDLTAGQLTFYIYTSGAGA